MLRRLDLYMVRQLLLAFILAAGAVSFVVLFTQSFRLLSFVIDNSGTLGVFAQLMGLMIPTFLPLIVPISLGIAVLFIYHKFAVDSEIVILRAAGLSPLRIAMPSLIVGASVVLLGAALTFWATPAANRSLVLLQGQVRDDYTPAMIRPGVFNDLADRLTFYARRRSGNGGFLDILVHDVRDPAAPVTVMAKSGLFAVENGIPQVIVFEGKRQRLDLVTGRLQQLDFDRYVLDLNLLRGEKDARLPDPRELSITQLIRAVGKPAMTNKGRGKVLAELHQRIAGPFLALTFAAIGATVILFGDFNRRGMTRRVAFASICIIIVQAAMIGLVAQIARYPWVAAFLYPIVLLPIPFCVFLLKRRAAPVWRFGRGRKEAAV